MNPISKRAFTRNSSQSRIEYAKYNTGNYFSANMCNNGEGGMYFESEEPLEQGSDIFIRLVDIEPGVHPPEACDGYRAEVMWCRKIYNPDRNSFYGVGVRFMVNVCDQCGNKMSYSNIFVTEKLFFLCVECYNRYQALEQGKLKECVDNYLMGNIL